VRAAYLQGVRGFVGAKSWCFAGEFVVIGVAIVVFWVVIFDT
jgi:hypothetical protein